MYGILRAAVKSDTVIPFSWEEFINLIVPWQEAVFGKLLFRGRLGIVSFWKQVCMKFVLSSGLGIPPEIQGIAVRKILQVIIWG